MIGVSPGAWPFFGTLALASVTLIGAVLTFVSNRSGRHSEQTVAQRQAETAAKAQATDASNHQLDGLRAIIQQQQDYIGWQDARIRATLADLDQSEAERAVLERVVASGGQTKDADNDR